MQLTVKDAAQALNVGEKTIYRWIQTGGLPAYRVAGQYRINRAMLFEWATSKRINFTPEDPAAGGGSPASPAIAPLPPAGLSQALRLGGIHYRIPGTTLPDVFQSVVSLMNLPDTVNRPFLRQALLAREQLQSTGIGDGVAIPHVRNPSVLGLPSPQVSLFFLQNPVEFDAIDGKPVHALFLPLSPNVRVHLHLLGKIAFALRQPPVKELVARAASADELLAAFRGLETANA
jgi:PTS system nitrogen regulatory IIA component